MSRFIALRYYHSNIERQISSLFNGNRFHYSCAAIVTDSERAIHTSFTIVHYRSLSQRSATVVEILFNTHFHHYGGQNGNNRLVSDTVHSVEKNAFSILSTFPHE